jgi:hypothetical protein
MGASVEQDIKSHGLCYRPISLRAKPANDGIASYRDANPFDFVFLFCSDISMTRKERLEYLKWKREMTGPQLTLRDQEFLDVLAKARGFTHGCDLGDNAWCLALQRLRSAIDEIGSRMTGDREYFWTKGHSIGGK